MQIIEGRDGYARFDSTIDRHEHFKTTFTTSGVLNEGEVKYVIPCGFPNGAPIEGHKQCYGNARMYDECTLTDYYVEYEIPLEETKDMVEHMADLLVKNGIGRGDRDEYKREIKKVLNKMATHDSNGKSSIKVESGSPIDPTGDSPSVLDQFATEPQIIFQSLFQSYSDNGLERRLSSDFSYNNKLCHEDVDAGKNPYPEDGTCPYDEDSPPISSGKEWINWIKSPHARNFIEDKLPRSLFYHELLDNRTDNLGNVIKDTVPRNCSEIRVKYDDKNIVKGYETIVNEVKAYPLKIAQQINWNGEDDIDEHVDSGYILTGRKRTARVIDILLYDESREGFIPIRETGKTIQYVKDLSNIDYKTEVKYKVKFGEVDVTELQEDLEVELKTKWIEMW